MLAPKAGRHINVQREQDVEKERSKEARMHAQFDTHADLPAHTNMLSTAVMPQASVAGGQCGAWAAYLGHQSLVLLRRCQCQFCF